MTALFALVLGSPTAAGYAVLWGLGIGLAGVVLAFLTTRAMKSSTPH